MGIETGIVQQGNTRTTLRANASVRLCKRQSLPNLDKPGPAPLVRAQAVQTEGAYDIR